MSLSDEARETGALIRALSGPALAGEGAPGAGWTERARGEDRLWVRREGDGPATFVSEGALPGPVSLAAALIKEADLGGLAGSLRRWEPTRLSPCQERIAYTSRLPWPLADRSFTVLERYGGGPGEALILGQDLEGAVAEAGTVLGSVICSAYRIARVGTGCALRRLIRIELHLPLPVPWTDRLLAGTFLADLDRLRAGMARPPAGLAQRMAQEPLYALWADPESPAP